MLASVLTETDDGEYTFRYDKDYAENKTEQLITFSMYVRLKEYKDNRLFPFFEGWIPEGWLLDVPYHNRKINPNDRM